MPLKRALSRVALLACLAAGLPAAAGSKRPCPTGEDRLHGKCVKLCATTGSFAQPEGCECPAGFGKLLLGTGGGQCERLRCPAGAAIDAGQECDCVAGYQKAPAGKGKVRCEAPRPSAK